MLARPEHGWSEVCIGDHRLRVSYIEPVPERLLTAFIRALSTGSAAAVSFDAEGWAWQLQSDRVTRLTILDGAAKMHTVAKSVHELAREAVEDIRRDLDAWSLWCCLPERAADNRALMIRLCNQLEGLLQCM